jgi:hypothetical protein
MVTSTHNHNGPDTLGLWGPTPFKSGVDADYLKSVESKIVDIVRAAEKSARPVAAKIGTAKAPELLRDSRKPIVLHDELTAVAFDDAGSGKPAGLLVQWNCHPETADSKGTLLTADYVGYLVKDLSARHGCPVVYLTGTVGGLMTTIGVEVKDESGVRLKEGSFEKTERYAKLLGKVADAALSAAKPVTLTPFDVRRRDTYLPIDNKMYQIGWQLGTLKRPIILWDGDPFPKTPQPAADLSKPVAIRTEVGLLRLGDLDVAAIPGEIYPELVLGKVADPADPNADFPDAPVEPSVYGGMTGKHRMLIGLANDEVGYIIPKRQWDEKPPFAYGLTKAPYGEVNSLGPETAPIICRAFRELCGKK